MTATTTAPTAQSATRAAPARQAGDPAWARPALLGLLAATALAYLWTLGASGWANDYYAAAVQAGTMSWKAMLFGALDPGNAITVDKPPAFLWLMALSGRLFGFSSWSMLVPQALAGVAAVALLYAAVKRWSGPAAGLVAGALLALTPVAALMFRFNNPDALLTLLLVAAAYCLVRATGSASTRWLLAAGAVVGFAFLAKMLQAFLVVPAFALVYLVAAPTGLWRRLGQLVGGGLAMVVAAGWWVALVELWPAGSRPYVGGSSTNSVLELTFGYNGLGRIFGQGPGGPGGPGGGPGRGGPGGGFGGPAGWGRMFAESFGGQISWLLPAALVGLAAGLWLTRRAPRTDRTRAALLLWGGWLLVTGLVFSFMEGIIHEYYSIALAPPIAAIVAVAGTLMWRRRHELAARVPLALMVGAGGTWALVLLGRTPEWAPYLRPLIAAATVLAALALAAGERWVGLPGWALASAAAVAIGLGPAASTLQTVTTSHGGSIVSAGPAVASGFGRFGPGLGGGFGGPGRGMADSELVALLESSGSGYRWAAATTGSGSAAPLQLASGRSVMAIGGFNGGDAAPTLAQFKQWVAERQVHWFVAGGFGGFGGRGGGGSEISQWVQENFTARTVGGQTVYDLTARA